MVRSIRPSATRQRKPMTARAAVAKKTNDHLISSARSAAMSVRSSVRSPAPSSARRCPALPQRDREAAERPVEPERHLALVVFDDRRAGVLTDIEGLIQREAGAPTAPEIGA
jgi:hypothetical protein